MNNDEVSQVSFPSGWSGTVVDAAEELEAAEDAFGCAAAWSMLSARADMFTTPGAVADFGFAALAA